VVSLREQSEKQSSSFISYITFRRDRCSRGGGVFICVNSYINCRELWSNEGFEMLAVEGKSRNPKFACEIVGIFRAPYE
jgi:hypothetical protein